MFLLAVQLQEHRVVLTEVGMVFQQMEQTPRVVVEAQVMFVIHQKL